MENPVDYITIDTAPTKEYFYGDPMWGSMISSTEYVLSPYDLTGLRFTLHMLDGTMKTYTWEDLDEDDRFGGYSYDLIFDETVMVGEKEITFSYMGREADYTIQIKESPVESIEVVNPLPYTKVSGRYMPYLTGLSFQVTMKDRTTQTVTSTMENTFLSENQTYGIEGDGIMVIVSVAEAEGDEETVTFSAFCYDKGCRLSPLEIAENTMAREVQNLSMTDLHSGGQVKVTWSDGKTETVTLKPNPDVFYENERDAYLLYQAEDGYLVVWAEKNYSASGELVSYSVRFEFWNAEMHFSAEKNEADVDGDGAVSSADAVYLLYHTLFPNRYPVDQDCDFDGDGNVTSADAVYLLYHTLFPDRYPV